MGSRRTGSRRPPREIRVANPDGLSLPVSAAEVRRAVAAVLDGEGAGPAAVSVTFMTGPGMRGLNRRVLRHDRSTDVIAFPLPHPGWVAGDVYVCPSAARRLAGTGVPEREELLRLVVHGTLHVLGHEHPAGPGRIRSPMWRRQESYLRRLAP